VFSGISLGADGPSVVSVPLFCKIDSWGGLFTWK
jgi:hypothetical protein